MMIINPYPFAQASDPYLASVSLLLAMSGEAGSTAFPDTSPSPKTVAAYGNAQISTENTKFGASSGKFDGSGDYLIVTPASAGDLGSGDFTAELWFCINSYPAAGSYAVLLDKQVSPSSRYTLYLGNNTPGDNGLRFNVNGTAVCGTSDGTNGTLSSLGYQLGTWYHAAVVRSGGVYKLYLDGVALPRQQSGSQTLSNSAALCIGAFSVGGSLFFDGFCCQLRFTPGVVRYAASFTPPTAPFPNS